MYYKGTQNEYTLSKMVSKHLFYKEYLGGYPKDDISWEGDVIYEQPLYSDSATIVTIYVLMISNCFTTSPDRSAGWWVLEKTKLTQP